MANSITLPTIANGAGNAEPESDAAGFVATRLLGITVVLLLLTQRLALPIGPQPIPFAVPIVFGMAIWGLMHRVLVIDKRRLIAYLASISLLIVSSVVVSVWGHFAASSLLYLVGLYLVLVLIAPHGDIKKLYEFHQKAMVVFAALGLLQFAVQLVGLPFVDPFAIVPEQLMLPNYNTIQPLSYGADLTKPNAGFFLEASHLSKALAFAILIELLYFRRLSHLVLFCCCYGFTFSGTGLVALAVGVATGIRYIPKQWLIGGAMMASVIGIGVAATGVGDVWIERAGEFKQVESSGSVRFITPYTRLWDVLRYDFRFFGSGAGSVEESFTLDGGVIAFDPTPVKLIFEYGIIPAIVFMGFMLYCLYTSSALLPLRNLAAVVLFFLTGGLLEAVTLYYCFLMAGAVAPANRAADRLTVGRSQESPSIEWSRTSHEPNIAT